jgi:hypothetical protein
MEPISVPFAPLPYKIVVGLPLLIVTALCLYWGTRNLLLCLRMLQGRAPLPTNSNSRFLAIGIVFHLVVVASGFGAALFFLALETTQPTIVSQNGILLGSGPLRYQQQLISWQEITEITCNASPRGNRVRSVAFHTANSRIALGNAGASLESVLALARTKLPPHTIRPCNHYSFDHSWSY